MSDFYQKFGKNQFHKLQTAVQLTPELEAAIDTFMNHINNENGRSEDCYRSEIYFWLKDIYGRIPESEYQALKDYYVFGGIYRA